jgi:shikimate kinase
VNILLIGYRGSGKTTVGQLLAARLNRPFADSDEKIVRLAGKSIAEIFRDDGEDHFRDLETRILKELLVSDGQILALGGGVILRKENRAAMKADMRNKIFYLHCEASELHRRIAADAKTAAHRPALTALGGSAEEIINLLAIRLPLYRQTMAVEIDVTTLTPTQTVELIAALL